LVLETYFERTGIELASLDLGKKNRKRKKQENSLLTLFRVLEKILLQDTKWRHCKMSHFPGKHACCR